jgi:hypothetical protein
MDDAVTPHSVFESANVVHLLPGDVVLFRCPGRLSGTARAHIAAMLDEVFPSHESIVLEGGQDIAVFRPQPGVFVRMWRRMFYRSTNEA